MFVHLVMKTNRPSVPRNLHRSSVLYSRTLLRSQVFLERTNLLQDLKA